MRCWSSQKPYSEKVKMIETLRNIQEDLDKREIITWEDVGKAFYGQEYVYQKGQIGPDVDFGVLIDSNLPEIIAAVEKDGKLKYFPIFWRKEEWDTGEEHFGFNHVKNLSKREYPYIQGRKPISAGFLPEYVTNELDPTIENHFQRQDRIERLEATNCPYKYLLCLEAGDINPRPLFSDTFRGLVNLLQHLEEQRKPWWFYFPIKDNPRGIRFP